MYVRWKRRPLKHRRPLGEDPGHSLRAVLVEGRRIDGRPRELFVKHLGSIPERNLERELWRSWFWKAVDAALDALALLDDDRVKIEENIFAHIPRPSADGDDRHAERHQGGSFVVGRAR